MRMPTDEEKKRTAENIRNQHVLDVLLDAENSVRILLNKKWKKADIFLLASQMKDIAERFD